jgi:hypothetical protein
MVFGREPEATVRQLEAAFAPEKSELIHFNKASGKHLSRTYFNGPLPLAAGGRKRPRRQGALRPDYEDNAPHVVSDSKRGLEIGNSKKVQEFYDHRFKCIEQTACKVIPKAFIKVIAPKKQANNPYTKRDTFAPDWWPKSLGSGEKDGKVRHIEPDHQSKGGSYSATRPTYGFI